MAKQQKPVRVIAATDDTGPVYIGPDGKPIDPRQRPYCPFGAARDLMECRDREILIEGPAGTGKTTAIWTKLWRLAEKYPRCRLLACRKTRVSMTASVLVTFEEDVLPVGHPCITSVSRKGRTEYAFPNGSVIVLGGLDKPERLFSTQFDVVAVFEATEVSEDEWEKFYRANRNHKVPYQQLIADCNPSFPTHWLNQRANTSKMTRLLSRHEDNPYCRPSYIKDLSNLTGPRRARFFEGKWAAVEGQVFGEWDAKIHLIDAFEVPKDWRRVRSIDFGYQNAFVCQWWAFDTDGRAFLYREMYRTNQLVQNLTHEIQRLSEGENIEATVADHGAQERAIMQAEGIATLAAKKDRATGQQSVKSLLQVQGDGKPRLYIMRDCLTERDQRLVDAKRPWCTEQEIEGYVHKKGPDGQPLKEDATEGDDHGCDAMRYMAMYVNPATATRVEFFGGDEPEVFRDLADDATDEEKQAAWLSPDNEELWDSL